MRKAALTKGDIDILLEGRRRIDSHISLRDKLDNEDKIKRSQSDRDSDHTKSISRLNEWLASQGFGSILDFCDWNNEMELTELKSCLEYISVCDHCQGYKGIPPCTLTCGGTRKSWFDSWKGSPEQYEYLYKESLALVIKYGDYASKKEVELINASEQDKLINVNELVKVAHYKVGDTYKTGYCPEGHGFVIKIRKTAAFPHWSI